MSEPRWKIGKEFVGGIVVGLPIDLLAENPQKNRDACFGKKAIKEQLSSYKAHILSVAPKLPSNKVLLGFD
ncbi:hypothetical protein Tco_1311181 [Tanacetum coccineum]